MPKLQTPSESEKITINLGPVDLGRIDLLVMEGFYANRTDFIRSAIRAQLATEREHLEQSTRRHMFEVGLLDLDAATLHAAQARGEVLEVRVVGLCRIAPDVTPDLARTAIGAIRVLGALQAPPAIRAALGDRIT